MLRLVRFSAGLLTQIPPRQMDENRLQARFGDRDVAQTKLGAGLDNLREKPIDTARKDSQTVRRGFGALDPCASAQLFGYEFRTFQMPQLQVDDGLRAEGVFQLLWRAKRQHPA